MADNISKITLPNNTTYDIKDTTARDGLATKQDTLVSGTNIKTINNESLLGSGNITVGGGSSLPDQTGHSGDILTTNGTAASWMDVSEASSVSIDTSISSSSTDSTIPSSKAVWDALSNVDALPDQTGHSGDFLTTNGITASWTDLPEETFLAEYNVTTFDEIKAAYDAGKYIFLKYLTLKEAHDVDVQWSLCPLTQYYYQELTSPNYKGEAYFLIPMNGGPPTPSLSYKYAWITINTAQQTGGWEVSSSSFSFAKSSHTHGDITNSGDITASAPTITTGDQLIINDESASKITNSGITFDTNVTTAFLRRDGTWATIPSEIPDQTGHNADILMSDGYSLYWGDEPKEIYLCTYGSTLFTELQIAVENERKLGVLKYLDKIYIQTFVDYTEYGGESFLSHYNFINVTDNEINKIVLDDGDHWSGPVSTTIPDSLPSQTGNSGKYLTTNGTAASWGAASATSTKSIDSSPTSSSSNLVTSGGVYTAINNKVNRTTAVNAADTNYTTLMARGVKLMDATSYDAVSDWSSELVNGAIAWRYE